MIHQSLTGPWEFHQKDEGAWHPATVPGCVHTDLLTLGMIPNPFVEDNEKLVQWVAETGWVYQRTFNVDPGLRSESVKLLVCNGLDTLAEVELNGSFLGRTDNMFRQWQWDVSDLLIDGENQLCIHLHSPVEYIRSRQAITPLTGGGAIPGGPHLRKAPCQWGWDWGPRLPPIGIWKDIRLEGYSAARLSDVHIRQHHQDGQVSITAAPVIEQWANADFQIAMKITSPDGRSIGAVSSTVDTTGVPPVLKMHIEDPQYWWPNGSGAQPLYRVEVYLKSEDVLLDQCTYRIGLRTIELRQAPDQWGESFTFIVNGVPVFAKGANWIPADAFPTRISLDQLERLIRSARDANMNMLRVWGGGYYPEDSFYDLCDEHGILLWQDFMFACGIYPDDQNFAENVRIEAGENIRRLRHHACLALWCGNNEMEQGWADWGWNQPTDYANQRLKAGYDRMFHHLLPEIVGRADPDHPYWPSSASSGIPFAEPNAQQRGDAHYWDVWHKRQPFTAYRSQYPRFMSEFGFQSLPPFRTIQTFAPPEEQNMTSYVMEHHQRSGSGNTLIMSQMADNFRMPKDFQSLVYLSMLLQAEGIRYGVEHWRRNMERVSGTLYWQLNDCWPVASWSSLDYYGRWKALHYAAKRFYAPLLLSVHDENQSMTVHLTSDLMTAWEGSLVWRIETLDGNPINAGEQFVHVPPLTDTPVLTLDFQGVITDSNRRNSIFVCELWRGGILAAHCVTACCPDKHLLLVDPGITADLQLEEGNLSLTLSAKSLARFVEIAIDGEDIIFSDNYFDLPANTKYLVTAKPPTGWTLEDVKRALQMRSLRDSYA